MAAPEPRWLSDAEQRAWRAYLAANRLLMVELERGHQQHGLSGSDYEVLVRLSEAPQHRLRMWELAKGTLLEKSRLSHQITRMERAGLVRRESCTGDRRGQFAVLTDHGWETIQRVAPSHVEQVRKNFIDRLNPDQVQTLTEIFAPMAEDLRQACPTDAEIASAVEPAATADVTRATTSRASAMDPAPTAHASRAAATIDPE